MKGNYGALFFPLTVLPFEKQLAAPGSLGLVIPLFNYRNILLTRDGVGRAILGRDKKKRRGIFFTWRKRHICREQGVKCKVTFPAPIIFVLTL